MLWTGFPNLLPYVRGVMVQIQLFLIQSPINDSEMNDSEKMAKRFDNFL